jgi:CBS-domain-containing membrane protein
MISAACGVAAAKLCVALGVGIWLSAPLAVSTALMGMQLTHTLHPPAAGTALIAVVGSPVLHALGFGFVLAPAGLGAALLVGSAAILNNCVTSRAYPKRWL